MDGLDAGAILKERYPAMGLVAYINEENDFLFLQLLRAGFEGIVLKRAGKKETNFWGECTAEGQPSSHRRGNCALERKQTPRAADCEQAGNRSGPSRR